MKLYDLESAGWMDRITQQIAMLEEIMGRCQVTRKEVRVLVDLLGDLEDVRSEHQSTLEYRARRDAEKAAEEPAKKVVEETSSSLSPCCSGVRVATVKSGVWICRDCDGYFGEVECRDEILPFVNINEMMNACEAAAQRYFDFTYYARNGERTGKQRTHGFYDTGTRKVTQFGQYALSAGRSTPPRCAQGETMSEIDLNALLEQVIGSLIDLPYAIEQIERQIWERETTLQNAREAAALIENSILRGEVAPIVIDGKNEAIRAAQLALHTHQPRMRVRDLEVALAEMKVTLRLKQNQLSAVRALARLLAGEER